MDYLLCPLDLHNGVYWLDQEHPGHTDDGSYHQDHLEVALKDSAVKS